MSRSALASIILTATAMIAGCAEQPDLLGRLLVRPETAGEFGYGIQWQSNLGLSPGERLLYARLLGNRLVTLESANVISAINAETGEVAWRRQVGRPGERFSRPVRYQDRIIICSETRAYVYDLYGELVQNFALEAGSSTTPAVYDGLVIHGSASGLVFAHDLQQGLRRWQYQTGEGITANPVLAGETLLVTNAAGELFAFEAGSGDLLWKKRAWEAISAPPVHDDRLVYVSSEDQSLYGFFLRSGKQAWRYFAEQPLRRTPQVFGDRVMITTPEAGLLVLDTANGKPVWQRSNLAGARLLMRKEGDLLLEHEGELVRVTPDEGRTVQRTRLPRVHRLIAGQNGTLYALRLNGTIMKLTPR